MAHSPSLTNTKWKTWLQAIASNKTIPSHYSWHQISRAEREPSTTIPDFNALKAVHKLPDQRIDINEYAYTDEQNPACSAYFIAQLERYNLYGLRANWGSNTALHDSLANLVFKGKDGVYKPNGEWWLYKYYAGMGGERVATTVSADRLFDVFATRSANAVKIIAGTRSVKAPYDINISGLSSLGLREEGTLNMKVYRFDWAGPGREVSAPVDVGTSAVAYKAGKVCFLILVVFLGASMN
jgi:hypothetical protein